MRLVEKRWFVPRKEGRPVFFLNSFFFAFAATLPRELSVNQWSSMAWYDTFPASPTTKELRQMEASGI